MTAQTETRAVHPPARPVEGESHAAWLARFEKEHRRLPLREEVWQAALAQAQPAPERERQALLRELNGTALGGPSRERAIEIARALAQAQPAPITRTVTGGRDYPTPPGSSAVGQPWTRCNQCGEPEHGSIPCNLAAPQPASPPPDDALRRLALEATDYLHAVKVLFDVQPEGDCLAERKPTKDEAAYRAFVYLNDQGKLLRAAIDAAIKEKGK